MAVPVSFLSSLDPPQPAAANATPRTSTEALNPFLTVLLM
jgi:hypothetical protein